MDFRITKERLRVNICSVIACAILAMILLFVSLSNIDKSSFNGIFHSICISVRGYVGLLCLFFLFFLIVLSLSKYGKIRLGGSDAKKEFSNFSWFSCLFMSGMGIGLLFYCQEPLFHLESNPYFGHVNGSPQSVAYSLTLFNWTFNAWSQYAILGLILAYFHYNHRRKLKISSIFPTRTNRYFKRCMDILMALGIVAGLCTSFGLGVAQLCSGLNYVFSMQVNPYILMLIIGLIATWSVNSGLKKGVKWLSNITTILIGLLLLVIVIIAYISLGVTDYIEYTTSGLKAFAINYFSYCDFFNSQSDSWAASWPVFYEMWYAAWAAFVSVFVAQISKGRTIREFIFGVVIMPTLVTILWFGIFGAIGQEIKDIIFPAMQSDITSSLFIFLKQLSSGAFYYILSGIVMICICLFFTTSSDSSSHVVATLLTPYPHPYSLGKILWSLVQCISAMVLFACGGLALVQSASVVLGVIVISIIFIASLYFLYTIIKTE